MNKYVSFLPLSILLLVSCYAPHDKEIIRVSGSTTVLPVVSKAAELFKLNHPDVMITVNVGGSGVGVNQVGEKTVHIGMISRDITDEDRKIFPGINFVTHLIGKDAVAVALSSEVYDSGIKTLTFQQIRAIYKGEITNWKNVGGPDKDILVIDKERARGTRHVFMKAVFGDKHAEAEGADLVLGSNNEEQTAIIQSDTAIGMLSLAWLNDDVKGVGIQIDNEAIEPSKENIVNGKYPISRDLLLVTDGEPEGILKEFIDFIKDGKGQEIVEESGYVDIN